MRSVPTTFPASSATRWGCGEVEGIGLFLLRHVLLDHEHFAAQRHGQEAQVGNIGNSENGEVAHGRAINHDRRTKKRPAGVAFE
jgi:hypothetical protein